MLDAGEILALPNPSYEEKGYQFARDAYNTYAHKKVSFEVFIDCFNECTKCKEHYTGLSCKEYGCSTKPRFRQRWYADLFSITQGCKYMSGKWKKKFSKK